MDETIHPEASASVMSNVVGFIQTSSSPAAPAVSPFTAIVPTTDSVLQGVDEAIPTPPLFTIVNKVVDALFVNKISH